MFKFVVLTALLAIASAGTIPFPGGKIVGGSATTIEDHPYQVSIQKKGSHFCGGSLIEADIVLTAAHCLQGSINVKELSIRAGSTDRKRGGQVVGVKSYRNHPSYNKKTHAYDVAIIRLTEEVIQNESVSIIGLASEDPETGSAAVVSGWGVKRSGALIAPTELLEVEVKIVDYKTCASDEYEYGSAITKTMLCAVEDSKDACQGDSGGPLVSGGDLVGVVSWGYGCAKAGYPGVYADVATLRKWIVSNAKTV